MNILISVDGVSHELFKNYWDWFSENNFSYVESLKTTFPSGTFNAHATAITGCSARLHQVFDNVIANSQTIQKIALYGDNSVICNEDLHKITLFHSTKLAGYKNACIHWPLTSDNNYVDGLTLEDFNKSILHDISTVENNDLNAFEKIKTIIDKKAYDFIAVRFIGYDTMSHEYGKDSKQALKMLDKIMNYVREIAVLLEYKNYPYNVTVFSDHGQSNIEKLFYPNIFLNDIGQQHVLEDNTARFVCDGSGSVLFYSLLNKCDNLKILELFLKSKDVESYSLINTDDPSLFCPVAILNLETNVCGEDIIPGEQPLYKNMQSVHGFDPHKVSEMNGFLVCKGKNFRKNTILKEESIINIAPTLAKSMHVNHSCEGTYMKELWRD